MFAPLDLNHFPACEIAICKIYPNTFEQPQSVFPIFGIDQIVDNKEESDVTWYLFLPDPTIAWFAICVFLKHHGKNADKSVINLCMLVRFSGKGRQMPNPLQRNRNITLVNISTYSSSPSKCASDLLIFLSISSPSRNGIFLLPFFLKFGADKTRRGRVRSVRTGKAYSPKFHRPSGLSIGDWAAERKRSLKWDDGKMRPQQNLHHFFWGESYCWFHNVLCIG